MDKAKTKYVVNTIACIGILLAFLFSGCDDQAPSQEDNAAEKKTRLITDVGKRTSAKAKKTKPKKKKLSKKEKKKLLQERRKQWVKSVAEAMDQIDETLPKAEQQISRGLKDALASEDLAKVKQFAQQARTATRVEVRSQAVEALSWFGPRAIADLTSFMGDADSEVADDAQRAWEQALSEIDDDKVKLEYLNTVMSTMNEREMLDAVAMNYHSIADEAAAVESLIGIIGQGGTAGEVAKETYEFVTGEEWKSRDAALTWAANQRKEAAEAELE